MEIKIRGRVRVLLNEADITKAIDKYRHQHSANDCILNYAMDCILDYGDSMPRHISHNIKMPERAIVNFRLSGQK